LSEEKTPEESRPVATVDIVEGCFVSGAPAVGILLSAGALTVDAKGEPCPGLFLEPWMARRVAYKLLLTAEEQDARARLVLTMQRQNERV
jgi:hypothetical protein